MDILNTLLNDALYAAMLVWLFGGISLFWAWGGVRQNALGLLSVGILFLTSGTLFIYVTLINVYARMDNAYLSNAFLGSYLILLGSVLVIGSLAGYKVSPWIVAALLVGVPFLGWYGVPLIEQHWKTPGSGLLIYAAFVIGGVLAYLLIRQQILAVTVALLLSTLSVLLVWLVYGAGTQAFVPVTMIADQPPYSKPPFLDFGPIFLCFALGVGLLVVGRIVQMHINSLRNPADAVALRME